MSAQKKSVLVLGARSDIARAIAAEFARKGYNIMLAGRDTGWLDRDASDMSLRFQIETTVHKFDALDLDGHEAFFDALPTVPSIVVCAVGLLGDQEADVQDPAAVRRIIDTNFTGPAHALEVAARRLAATEDDTAIVGIGSVAGDRGRAKNYLYGAAKAGFGEYLSGMRQKYVQSRLHVMTVKPGFVATAMTEGMDLPGPLTSTPEKFAKNVVRALDKRRMVYYDLRWRVLMGVITHLPERIFVRTKF
ncbi:MAG: SDR family oxidoreductase [Rhodobacteraceae bacterium]|nr:SDR family oxidoreductase [Paracoccaceae bacterium]